MSSPRSGSTRRFRAFAYRAARAVGLFALARRLYRNRQCILCYHAFAYEDEHEFRPQLYMSPQQFAARLDFLSRRGYRVISLDEAVRRVRAGVPKLRDVAITIDDGFTSVHDLAAPQLNARGLPATLYLTTYYVDHALPVWPLALQYVVWKSRVAAADLDLQRFGMEWPGPHELRGAAGERTIDRVIAFAEERLDESGRQDLLRHIAQRLDVDAEAALADRRFHLITPAMAQTLARNGVDVQLHTHRHRFPERPDLLVREIEDNRSTLRHLGTTAAVHFCYPSGEWRASAFPILAQSGIASATTCLAGLNRHGAEPLALRRFLDASDIPEVEFEAEVCGFKQLLRDVRARLPI